MKFKFCSKCLFVILSLVLAIFLSGCGGLITPATDEAEIKVDISAVVKSIVDTDNPDYSPGDYVLVTGSGWLPGETVKLDFLETLSDPIFQQTSTYYAVADSEGKISDTQYLIELRHLGATFILTATGQTSGLVATTTFTDTTHYNTVTTLDAISSPLAAGQTGVSFSGTVSVSGTYPSVPNGAPVVLQYSTESNFPGGGKTTTAATVSTSGGTGSISGTFTAPSTAGTYYFRAHFANYNVGGGPGTTWDASDSATQTITINAADTTLPDTSIASGPTGWINTQSATFTWTGSDNVTPTANLVYSWNLDSGTWSAYSAATTATLSSLSEGSHIFYVKAKDAAENEDSTPASRSFSVDCTPPVVTITAPAADYYKAATLPALAYTVADNLDPSPSVVVTGWSTAEGEHTVTVTATDAAGNEGEASVTYTVDNTPPVITAGTPAGDPGDNGWWVSAVTVPFSATDNLSGFAPNGSLLINLASETTDGEGAALYVTSDGISDRAGNLAVGIQAGPFKVDWTKPVVTITVPAEGAAYTLGQTVLADWTATDDSPGSGIASAVGTVASGLAIDTGTIGSKGFEVTATDNAGNTRTLTVTYSVIYKWDGFFRPVDNTPTLNVAKAGSAIPVKFSLSGNQGLNIFAEDYPKSVKIVCNTGAPTDDIEDTVTAGGSSLNYDAAADQYVYVWKTQKGWANTCRQLVVLLIDGTYHRANFKFK